VYALFIAALLIGAGDFPEIEDGVLGIVGEDVHFAPVVGPDDDTDAIGPDAPEPRRAEPTRPTPPPPPARPQVQPRHHDFERMTPTPSEPKRPAAKPEPAAAEQPPQREIEGYHHGRWGNQRDVVQSRFDERPLLERGEGQWFIQDECEGQRATVTYAFAPRGLRQVTCTFRQGLQGSRPDAALYREVQASLTKKWGPPNVRDRRQGNLRNTAWVAGDVRAFLLFDANAGALQLRVENRGIPESR
jgi:hypothetical protein